MKLLFLFFCMTLNLYSTRINIDLLKSKIYEYSQPSSWAFETINQDLSQWSSAELSKENIKYLASSKYSDPNWLCSLIVIKNNKIEMFPINRNTFAVQEKILFQALTVLSRVVGLKDTVCISSYHDGFNEDQPVLCYSKLFNKKSIMIPDFEALHGYSELTQKIYKASLYSPWHRKKDLIFWRGSLTGATFRLDNYHNIPRSKLVTYANSHPNIIDAKFIQNGQADQTVIAEMKKHNYFGNRVSQEESLQYKFLIDIDGNSCCFSRTYWTLLSNCLVFKIKSNNIQWYYHLLKDKENYIQINSDLSNLEACFYYYLSNQEEAQSIAKKATNTVQEHLSQEAVLAYLYHVVNKISQIQKE